jgi:hypothetical protein
MKIVHSKAEKSPQAYPSPPTASVKPVLQHFLCTSNTKSKFGAHLGAQRNSYKYNVQCLSTNETRAMYRKAVAEFRLCVGHDCLGTHFHPTGMRPDAYCYAATANKWTETI